MVYDATFMLYASLEASRPIAQGKMHTSPHPPVLTGVAVASTAYLERPNKAGYFIFPDLSVRHEGWYRLKFSLFEAVKHPEDADLDREFRLPSDSSNTDIVQHQSMANRMEVQSIPFQVFSAKKFPGLDESTEISKLVAEQGCRVRIRREIRQRKRHAEGKADDDKASIPASPAPSFYGDHVRSASRSSDYYRQSSMDYPRPAPSRNPSVTSMTHPSPSHTVSMPPPPPMRSEAPPFHSPRSTDLRYMPTAIPMSLPPFSALAASTQDAAFFNPNTRQWDLPPTSTSKRSYSDDTYDVRSPMKAGYRPDNNPIPGYQPIGPDQKIEADIDEGPEDPVNGQNFLSGPYSYQTAGGEVKTKNSPSGTRGMNLLSKHYLPRQ